MKRIVIVVLAFLVMLSITWGQTKYVAPKKGDQAIVFDFDGLNISMYKGGLGYKRYINESLALRTVLSFLSTKSKYTWASWYGFDNVEGYNGDDGYDKTTKFGIEVAAEKHLNKGKVDPFYGAGAGISIQRSKFVEPIYGIDGGTLSEALTVKNDYPDAHTRLSLFGIFGLEYALNSMLSFAAEYQLLFALTSYPDTKTDNGEGTEITTENGSYRYFGISSGAGLSILIYFNR